MMENRKTILKIRMKVCIIVALLCCLTIAYKAEAQSSREKPQKQTSGPSDKAIKDALTDLAYDKYPFECLKLKKTSDGKMEITGKRNVNVIISEVGRFVEDGSYWPIKASVSCDIGGTRMILGPNFNKFKIYKDKEGNWKAEEMK